MDYYVYVHLDVSPVVYGVATSDPPHLGGVVVHTFQDAPNTPHPDLIKTAAKLTGPLRMEYQQGRTWAPGVEEFPATDIGLDEALLMGKTLREFGHVRLVTAQGCVIREW